MPTLPVPFADVRTAVEAYHAALDDGWPSGVKGQRSALVEAAVALGLPERSGALTVRRRLDIAAALGMDVRSWTAPDPEFSALTLRRYRTYDEEFRAAEARLTRPVSRSRQAAAKSVVPDHAAVVAALRKPATVDELAKRLNVTPGQALDAVLAAVEGGAAVMERNGLWQLETAPALGSARDDVPELLTEPDGTLLIGAIGDNHACSKYSRQDCLEEWYDEAERRGIRTVLHAGNWIDGEADFNRHDLLVHGMDAQMQYLAKHYPQRPGIETWAITGADHEGWYARREGVDVGRYAERVMRDAGRTDWRDLGYMESYIRLRHADSGASSMLCLMHPGGGSAYAISYAPQKIVEGFDGGDKPAVLLIGHYHKASYQLTRNVHTIQVGCFQDQTVFMRQRKLSAHVGGMFVGLRIDPRTGAVIECTTTFRNYFIRDYYSGRWSQHGDVRLAERVPA